MFSKLLAIQEEEKDVEEIKEEYEDLEFQMFRIQANLKEIAKEWQVIGLDQTKHDNWVIVYAHDNGRMCNIMLCECNEAFRGNWDFMIQAKYKKDNSIHIGDIKGEENKGFGSICMNYLKEVAEEQNVQYITGDIAKRDWDHLDRLIHFYKKHNFDVDIDYDNKNGEIQWNLMNEFN